MTCRILAIFFMLAAVSTCAIAGGPLLVGGPNFGVDGAPFVWDNARTIQYRTDGGNLGSLSNAAANSLVTTAFSAWTSIPTVSLTVQRIGPLQGIADVVTIADYDSLEGSVNSGAQTAVVYDASGALFHALFSDPNVIGFAGPRKLSATGKIATGIAAINGQAGGSDMLKTTMVHEFGHLLGLDHTQVNCRALGCLDADNANIPTMFPILFDSRQAVPKADDRAWISNLYPSSRFAASYGAIKGRVLFSDGTSPVQDAVVIARQVGVSPAGVADQSAAVAVSSISGYRFTGNPGQPYSADYLRCTAVSPQCPTGYFFANTDGDVFGSRNPELIGSYEIPLPPGMYTLEVRTIGNGYTSNDIGPLLPAIPLPGPEEFWNSNESATDSTFEDVGFDVLTTVLDTVTVVGGATTSPVDFILNGTPPTSDDFDSGPVAGSAR